MALAIGDLIDMVANASRWHGTSSDIPGGIADLPTEGVGEGSTFYVADTGVTYEFCKGQWYEMA